MSVAIRRRLNVSEVNTKAPVGVHSSGEARERVFAIYDAKLARWPIPFEELNVPTRYGSTHIVASGNPAAPPVIFVHPAGTGAFAWRKIIASIGKGHRSYALDTIGDAGKSVLSDITRYPKSGTEYSGWLKDVFDQLKIGACPLVGWSMGGWITLNFAADHPERVTHLALLCPMGLPSWPVTLRVLLRLAFTGALPSPSRKQKLIEWAIGNDPAAHGEVGDWMDVVIETRAKPRLGKPLPLPASKLRAIEAPTLLMLAGRDGPIGDANRAAARARKYVRDVDIEVLPDNTHALGIEAPEHVAQRLLAFFVQRSDG